MSDLSVTKVQEHLRNLAELGHDMVSRPGGLIFHDKPYPMAYGHGLLLSDKRNAGFGLSMLPVSESGNVGLVDTSTKSANASISSTTLMHPLMVKDDLSKRIEGLTHWYTPHPDEDDYDIWTNPEIKPHEALQKMGRAKGRLTVVGERVRQANQELEEELPLSRLHEHNPADATWNTIANNMAFGRSEKEFPLRPKNLELASLGHVIHVHDASTKSGYLYHPESEKLIKL